MSKYKPALRIHLSGAGGASPLSNLALVVTPGNPPTTRQVIPLHGLVGGGTLDNDIWISLDTPGACDAQSENNSSQNHTHQIDAEYNPGQNERLLRTNEDGEVVLFSLEITGSLTMPVLTAEPTLQDGQMVLWMDSANSRFVIAAKSGGITERGYVEFVA